MSELLMTRPGDAPPRRSWGPKLLVATGFLALAMLAAWGVRNMKAEAPKRHVAKIALLPDTPPPPPPPKEEKKPEPPKDEPKQVVREEQLKQAEAPKPANEPLKMEGAAGDGPSAFAAGAVGKDYTGGNPVTGAPSAAGGTQSDRAQERFYANTARQLLRDEIERHLKSDADQLTATFSLWLQQDGSIQRFELTPSGDASADRAMQLALDETRRLLKLPPPPAIALAQPLRFKLSVRPQA